MPTYTATIGGFYRFGLYAATVANLSADTFKMILLNSSYTPSQENDEKLADIVANEISGSGYSRQTLTNVTWTRSSGVATFDCDPVVFTASGGDITARRYVVYDDTTTSPADLLVCYGLLNSAGTDVTATNGNTLTVTPNASGLFTLTVP